MIECEDQVVTNQPDKQMKRSFIKEKAKLHKNSNGSFRAEERCGVMNIVIQGRVLRKYTRSHISNEVKDPQEKEFKTEKSARLAFERITGLELPLPVI